MSTHNPSSQGRGGPDRGGRAYRARPASELMGAALRSLGVPSAKVTDKLEKAWRAAGDEAWRDHTTLRRLEGGVLEVAVASEALRDELTNFHRARLLSVLRAALPDVPLVGIRFLTDEAGGTQSREENP